MLSQVSVSSQKPNAARLFGLLSYALLGLFWVFRPAAASAQAAPGSGEATSAPTPLQLNLTRYSLANGLRVVLNPDGATPAVSVCVTYDVGSRNEQIGRSGFAHLFEHMMFQGSRNVDKGEHFRKIAERGGKANGTTNKDRTNYYQTLPSSELELALWLEADRMQTLAVNRANFENQRAIVLEEYRMRYSGRAYALGYHRLHQLVFQGYWPYEHPTIGFIEDLDEAQFRWVRKFHRQYYVPNNAVLSISGSFDVNQAKALVEKHFADQRPNNNLPAFDVPDRMPRQTSERLSVIVDHNAKTPGVFYGYRIPATRTRTHRALELASLVLSGGDSSRLHQSLVIEKAAVNSVASWTAHHRGPDAFVIKLAIAPLSSIDTAQRWLDGEMKRLRLIGPSERELSKAKAQMKMRLLGHLQTNQARARWLGTYETYWGDASLLAEEYTAYDDISATEIRQAAAQYLIETRRSIVEIYPPGWVRDIGPVVVTKTHVVKKGENLIRIARMYGTTADKLAKQNGISLKAAIVPGQRLLVTAGSGYKPKTHTVKSGESLIGIAKQYGVTAKELAAANNISTKKPIFPGQELTVPKSSQRSKKERAADKDSDKNRAKSNSRSKRAAPKSITKTYTVKKGDTLSGIAAKHGVSVAALTRENKISRKRNIIPGQKLKITVEVKPAGSKKRGKSKAKSRKKSQ